MVPVLSLYIKSEYTWTRLLSVVIISGGYGVATGGPLAWGLCYNKEMSPSQTYCDDYYKYTYPCTPGVSYHGRGALPLYWYKSSYLWWSIHPPIPHQFSIFPSSNSLNWQIQTVIKKASKQYPEILKLIFSHNNHSLSEISLPWKHFLKTIFSCSISKVNRLISSIS